mmetsp:Transcript_47247/g.74674  ORF Transcript_47247/g.74674 Transcript_47247/m.74674 type:complete len:96 (+) Transcript_47247:1717-2004(+)
MTDLHAVLHSSMFNCRDLTDLILELDYASAMHGDFRSDACMFVVFESHLFFLLPTGAVSLGFVPMQRWNIRAHSKSHSLIEHLSNTTRERDDLMT